MKQDETDQSYKKGSMPVVGMKPNGKSRLSDNGNKFMKKIKFVSTVITLVLALWASNAGARPLVGPGIKTLHFDLVLGQQGLVDSNSAPNTYVSTINSVRITDKYLLNFLADAFHTNWPAGAQLALEQSLNTAAEGSLPYPPILPPHIFIVDKSGTNLIFDATQGINIGETNIAYFSYASDNPVFAGKIVDRSPVLGEMTTAKIVTFKLYSSDGASLTSLNFQGLSVLQENYDRPRGSDTITDHASVSGDGTLDGTWSVVSGEVSGLVPNLIPP
jgi:hypothetical protein